MIFMVLKFDIAVIGSGLSGITASYHALKNGTRVAIIGDYQNSNNFVNPVAIDDKLRCCIGRYLGSIPYDIKNSRDLILGMLENIHTLGVKSFSEDAIDVTVRDMGFNIKIDNNSEIRTDAIIFAIGKRNKQVIEIAKSIENYDLYLNGYGLSFNAECDSIFYKGRDVVVYGNGSSARYAIMRLRKIARKLYLIPVGPLDKKRFDNGVMKDVIVINSRVVALSGKRYLERVHLSNGEIIDSSAVFIEFGPKWIHELGANVGIFPEVGKYLQTDERQSTYVDGIFACGSLCGPPYTIENDVITGSIAGENAANFIKQMEQ